MTTDRKIVVKTDYKEIHFDPLTIPGVREALIEIQSTHPDAYIEYPQDDDHVLISFSYERPETDEEWNLRLLMSKDKEARDRMTYESLKKRFEKDAA